MVFVKHITCSEYRSRWKRWGLHFQNVFHFVTHNRGSSVKLDLCLPTASLSCHSSDTSPHNKSQELALVQNSLLPLIESPCLIVILPPATAGIEVLLPHRPLGGCTDSFLLISSEGIETPPALTPSSLLVVFVSAQPWALHRVKLDMDYTSKSRQEGGMHAFLLRTAAEHHRNKQQCDQPLLSPVPFCGDISVSLLETISVHDILKVLTCFPQFHSEKTVNNCSLNISYSLCIMTLG